MKRSDGLKYSLVHDPAACLTEWDEFVAGMKNGHVFQTARWALYRQKVGWQPVLLSWSSQGSLRAVCLVLHRSIAGLPVGGVLYAPRGPVLDYDSADAPLLLSEVLNRLKQLARRYLAVVRVSPDVRRTTTWVQELLEDGGFHRAKQPVGHTATIRLDLTQPLDQIIDGMSRARRSDVYRYERQRADYSFDCDDSLDSLRLLYEFYCRTIENAGKSPKSFNDLRMMHETLAPFGSSLIFIVRYQDRPVAAVNLIPTKGHLWGFGASMAKGDEAARDASVGLYWEMIKWAKNQGYTEFDLQGIPDPPDPEDPLYGVYRFKRRWGGEEVQFVGEYDYTPYPFMDRALEWRLSRGKLRL